jgi:NAD(P)-dependent dehydrogenase (short-subunit alcohol dehydrogenase family)
MNVAVVTGSARGIGNAIAGALEKTGYDVVYSDIMDSFDEAKAYCKCDISIESDRRRLLDYVLDRFGKVDLLVNNAGVAPLIRQDIMETTQESFDRLININLKGTFFMCQIFANAMVKQETPESRIINIASVSSYTSSVQRGEYCISKAGVSMVTQLFADRLAEHGIGVFEIRPGIILTDMTAAVKEKYDKLISEGITPIKRFGMPEDVAKCVLAVTSGNLDFATGQVLNADGGFHIRRL